MSLLLGGLLLGLVMTLSYVMSFLGLNKRTKDFMIDHPIVPDTIMGVLSWILLLWSPAVLNVVGGVFASVLTSILIKIAGWKKRHDNPNYKPQTISGYLMGTAGDVLPTFSTAPRQPEIVMDVDFSRPL